MGQTLVACRGTQWHVQSSQVREDLLDLTIYVRIRETPKVNNRMCTVNVTFDMTIKVLIKVLMKARSGSRTVCPREDCRCVDGACQDIEGGFTP